MSKEYFMYETNISIGVLRMVDKLEIDEVIRRIRFSSLSFSSRQIIYSRLINEVWGINFHDLKSHVGIDDAFDKVYIKFQNLNQDDEDYSGC